MPGCSTRVERPQAWSKARDRISGLTVDEDCKRCSGPTWWGTVGSVGFKIVVRSGRVGFCIENAPFCTAGSSLSEGNPNIKLLKWKEKAKTLNERFFALLMVLAMARKFPEHVRERLSLRIDDDGFVSLSELHRLRPLRGTKTVEIMRHDICNNFQLLESEVNATLQVLKGTRGKPEEDRLRLALPPNAITIANDADELLWSRLLEWNDKTAFNSLSLPGNTTDPGHIQAPNIFEHDRDGSRPFRPGRPIGHPQSFFGRSEHLKSIFSWWQRAPLHNVALLGSRLSGKTSLVRHLLHLSLGQELRPEQQREWHPRASGLKFVLVDFEDARLHRESALLRYLLEQMELPVPQICDMDHFFEVVSVHLHRSTVILLDHIGTALARRSDMADREKILGDLFWDSLRALTCNYTNGKLAFLLAAHELPSKLAHRYNRSSSFFSMFRTLNLGPLEDHEARELIASSPIEYPNSEIDWLLEVTGRWPRLLQVACDHRFAAIAEGSADAKWKNSVLRDIEPLLQRTRG